jgi:dTDP-4-dehydrorhamnose reductase
VDGRRVVVTGAGAPMSWFEDELRQPASAREIARAIWRIGALPSDERSGSWHLPGPELVSRHEIACRIARALGLDDDLVRAQRTPPGAERPRVLRLDDQRARSSIGWSPSAAYAGLR